MAAGSSRIRLAYSLEGDQLMKKTYEKPAIIHSEKIEGRAAACAKVDGGCVAAGTINS